MNHQPLREPPAPLRSLHSAHHSDRTMSSLTQFSDLSLSEEFDEVVKDDDRNDLSFAPDRNPLSYSQDLEKISPRLSQKGSLPPMYVKSNVIDSKEKGNPNWRPMASHDVAPLKINRSVSIEKSID